MALLCFAPLAAPASTLVAVTSMHENGVGVFFTRFVVLAFSCAVMGIAMATTYVVIFLA